MGKAATGSHKRLPIDCDGGDLLVFPARLGAPKDQSDDGEGCEGGKVIVHESTSCARWILTVNV